MKVNLGHGKWGVQMTVKNGVCYIEGSNHLLEWLHNVAPGARYRERRWGAQVVDYLAQSDEHIEVIAGHSLGGTVACTAAGQHLGYYLGKLRLYTYGAKRPARPFHGIRGHHYRIKGDLVPYMPPWRQSLRCAVLDYGRLSPGEAHKPSAYYEQMKKDGVR